MAEIVAFAKSEGYEFSARELTAYASKAKKELSDDELRTVAGGAVGKTAIAVGRIIEFINKYELPHE